MLRGQLLVHAAASAGIDLLDVPFLNLEDAEGLRQEATACVRLGFTGKASIHPNQIAIIHAALDLGVNLLDTAAPYATEGVVDFSEFPAYLEPYELEGVRMVYKGGRVVEASGSGADAEAVVIFTSVGRKKLLLTMAPLKRA